MKKTVYIRGGNKNPSMETLCKQKEVCSRVQITFNSLISQNNLTSSSTLHQIWRDFCEQLSVFPQASSSLDWQGLYEWQHCKDSFITESPYISVTTCKYYRCCHSPWLEYLVLACSQSEEWIQPSPCATHLVALQRM